jgi:hypothetical protein
MRPEQGIRSILSAVVLKACRAYGSRRTDV